MVIVNILGGLGNQMFQYAIGKALALESNQALKLDVTSFKDYVLRNYELNVFNIDCKIATEEEIKMLKYRKPNFFEKLHMLIRKKSPPCSSFCRKEKYYYFDSEVLNRNENTYLFGYWQSEKYFLEYKDILMKEFTLKNNISTQSSKYQKLITSQTSISLHIRRGDYITNKHTNTYHGTTSLSYYKKAVMIIKEKLDNPYFFMFSDDMDWVKNNFDFIENGIFVELPQNIPDYEEMYLMSICKHNIIANSSFSWWGAWLNQNPEKIIIAPKKWFNDSSIDTKDLIPDTWLRI